MEIVMSCFAARATHRTIPITPLTSSSLKGWLKRQPAAVGQWVQVSDYLAAPGSVLLIPADSKDAPVRALVGVANDKDIWSWGVAAAALPDGSYRLDPQPKAATSTNAGIGWALGVYEFSRYREPKRKCPKLVWPSNADRNAIERTVSATYLVRDLINTPANDMGPAELAAAARRLAREFKAKCRVIVGDDLLRQNCPAIHAVGRASDSAPRLIDITWGSNRHPKLTLVGKGVCFDTGGLDLKPAAGMKLMKKDMGGGAHALGLARMVMMAKLPVRLRVLVPAVENSVAGNAYRPFDVIDTRKGLTVEIGNTDAEGRLVLADALAMACEESPELLLDFATLTGAARVAVGTDLAAMFCNDDKLAENFSRCSEVEQDPVWRMPLWQPYRHQLDGKVADLNNVADGPFGGAIIAALFLEEFVGDDVPWAHFDIMAWNPGQRPGRPEGGEAMAMRAAFAVIQSRFAKP
jgi:leucyl aminopeptidase